VRQGRVATLAKKIFRQGLTPPQLALTIALGAAVGIMPLLWGATPLCALLAFRLRLNQFAIQAVNYLLYPLQIALFLPFYSLGAAIFPWGPALPANSLLTGWQQDLSGNLFLLLVATLKALGAWLLLAPFLAGVLYFLLLAILKKRGSDPVLMDMEGEARAGDRAPSGVEEDDQPEALQEEEDGRTPEGSEAGGDGGGGKR
jgi:hypothetical protein